MATKIRLLALIPFLFIMFFQLSLAQTIFNVQSFGARVGGTTDCAHSFLSAWAAACASAAPSTIYVPPGTYLVGGVTFSGQTCKSNAITMRINGTLVAPANFEVLGPSGNWIKFDQVNGVSIIGGTIDGQGVDLWRCKSRSSNCPEGATSLEFSGSNNIIVNGLSSVNSQFFHLHVFGSQNVNLQGLRISAPGNSINTDGVHISTSSGVTIANSVVGTGDDCISIGPGVSNLHIQNIFCGPGHGISIGSLGATLQEPGVQNVTVSTVTFTRTQNGVRIKTFGNPSNGFVHGVLFQHAIMIDVQNPIIINQNYCDQGNCGDGQASGVRISDVRYQDIRGTSATQVAVDFACSKTNPCNGITLENVNLSFQNQAAMASCLNAVGSTSGLVNPTSCLN